MYEIKFGNECTTTIILRKCKCEKLKVIEPILVFTAGGEIMSYIRILELQKWIMHHIYAPEIKVL